VNPIKEIIIPRYLRVIFLFIGIVTLLAVLYIAQAIIVPLIFALIIAILLHPVVNFFVYKKINRLLAIIITLIITVLVFAALGMIIFSQASRFGDSWPVLVEKFDAFIKDGVSWASGYFDINSHKIEDWLSKAKIDLIKAGKAALGHTLYNIGNGLVILFLIPVYIFLILFYHPILIEFIRRIFSKSDQSQLSEIITQTKTVIQRYLFGLVIETIIVAILNSTALLILGIPYAILIGIIGGLLNLIPYVGGLVAVAIPMIIALATKTTAWYALYVLAFYYFIQLVDNNFLVPKIVASRVKLNALFSIIVIIAGNALWGIPGMFLSIPLLAIVKLICDHVESLKPWGFLLGDTMPSILKIKPIFKKTRIL
jgi:predicted PurR-regulated permease PerM